MTLRIEIQVFFRAGVLGQMEELRDDRLGKIVSWMQAYVRGYLSRKEFKKLQDQRWEKWFIPGVLITPRICFVNWIPIFKIVI